MTDRPIDPVASDDDNEWGAELFQVNGAPEEPAAAERAMGRDTLHYNAEDVIPDPQTREALTLLAMAVAKLGGSFVITPEELQKGFKFGFDVEYSRRTGGVRIYAWQED